MRNPIHRFGLIAGMAVLAAACGDSNSDPVNSANENGALASSADKFWESGATVAWNRTARELLVARAVGAPHLQVRILAYLSLAQYNAAVAAEDTKSEGAHASPAAAVGGASVAVLKSFFPLDGALLEGRLSGATDFIVVAGRADQGRSLRGIGGPSRRRPRRSRTPLPTTSTSRFPLRLPVDWTQATG